MRNKTTAALLALLLGGLGIHRFYMGRWFTGLLYLIFCWTFVPMVFGFIEGIFLLIHSEQWFQKNYGDGTAPTYDSHVKCPDCRELISAEASKCRYCGCALIPQIAKEDTDQSF